MAETVTCPKCGSENESAGKPCRKCATYILAPVANDADASEEGEEEDTDPALDYLSDISASVKTIKNIAIWWLILSILSVIGALSYILSKL